MWTSRGVRSTTEFGYVYPETQSWIYPTKKEILAQLDVLYPNSSLAKAMKADADKLEAELKSRANALLAFEAAKDVDTAGLVQIASPDAKEVEILASAAQRVELPPQRNLANLVKDNKYLEWLVDIRAKKHARGGNYAVHVFLGLRDDDHSSLYIADPNHIATFSTFGSGENTACENCKNGQEAGLEVTGQIPLTLALVERYLAGKLESISPDHVIEYLQRDLHWRVTNRGGSRCSRSEVDGLLVGVVSNEVTLPENSTALPQYAPTVTPWPAATTNKEGGSRGKGTGYIEGGY